LTLSKPQTYREFVLFFIIFDNDLCERLAAFVHAHEIVLFSQERRSVQAWATVLFPTLSKLLSSDTLIIFTILKPI